MVAFLLFVLSVSQVGCRRPLPDFGPSPHEEAETVLTAVRSRQLSPDSIIADARVRLVGPDGRGSADHFIVTRKPADLRLEMLSFFGNPMALVLVSDGTFVLWEIDANRAWEGPATADNLAALLPINLDPEAIVGLLTGMPLLFEGEKHLELDHQNRRYLVSLRRGREWQQLLVHPHDYTLDEVRWIDSNGTVFATLHYDRYKAIEGELLFPHEIRYETRDDVSLRVLYRDITFDPEHSMLDNLFSLTLPGHVQVSPLHTGFTPPRIMPDSDVE